MKHVIDCAPNELGATFIFEYIIEVRNVKIKIKNVKNFTFCFSINKKNKNKKIKKPQQQTKRFRQYKNQ